MGSEPVECAFCGLAPDVDSLLPGVYFVGCAGGDCCCCGPDRPTTDEAVDAWNLMMSWADK